MMDKYELKQQLQGGIATVTFEKKDGSMRTMRCTLLAEYLPAPTGPQLLTESTRQESDQVLSVWDIENGGWRSFRLDSIKSITVGA
jgi:hypothetical protein